jgi:hypothetical protein
MPLGNMWQHMPCWARQFLNYDLWFSEQKYAIKLQPKMPHWLGVNASINIYFWSVGDLKNKGLVHEPILSSNVGILLLKN